MRANRRDTGVTRGALGALLTEWRGTALLLLGSLLQAVPAAAAGWLIATALDDGFLVDRPEEGAIRLGILAGLCLVGAAGGWCCAVATDRMLDPVRDELAGAMVRGVLRRGSADPTAIIPATEGPDAISRHLDEVHDSARVLIGPGRAAVVTAGAAIGGLAVLDDKLAMVAGATLGGAVLLGGLGAALRFRGTARLMTIHERSSTAMARVVQGQRDLVAGRATRTARAELDELIEAERSAESRAAAPAAVGTALVSAAAAVPLLAVLAALPDRAATEALTSGELVGVVACAALISGPALRMLPRALGAATTRLTVSLRRIAAIAETGPVAWGPQVGLYDAVLRGLDLTVYNVAYRYGNADEPVFDGFRLTVPHGEHLAVVGGTGSGRSTLAALLTGVLRPQRGAVSLGRIDVTRVRAGSLHTLLTLVPQHPYVFRGTLRENLAYLRPSVRDRELVTAAEALGACDLLKNGLDAPADGLGPAQRQLLTLLRAYVSGAAVVVLDQATSRLDPALEARVENAFRERGGTLVVVAYRLDSAIRADRVLLLDGPRSAVGEHTDLLEAFESYRRLWEGPRIWRSGGRRFLTPKPPHQRNGRHRLAGSTEWVVRPRSV